MGTHAVFIAGEDIKTGQLCCLENETGRVWVHDPTRHRIRIIKKELKKLVEEWVKLDPDMEVTVKYKAQLSRGYTVEGNL